MIAKRVEAQQNVDSLKSLEVHLEELSLLRDQLPSPWDLDEIAYRLETRGTPDAPSDSYEGFVRRLVERKEQIIERIVEES